MTRAFRSISACLFVLLADAYVFAQPPEVDKAEAREPHVVELVKEKLTVPVPGEWESVEPRTRIIAHEFAVAPTEAGADPGRMTIVMAAGGVEANVARWAGQYKTADGKPLAKDAPKVEKRDVDGLTVHVVDISGTFADQPSGPTGPTISRPGYRMLAAIVPTRDRGTWFLRLYGPEQLIAAEKDRFDAMVNGISSKL